MPWYRWEVYCDHSQAWDVVISRTKPTACNHGEEGDHPVSVATQLSQIMHTPMLQRSTDPTATDDVKNEGVTEGAIWLNETTGVYYWLMDATPGAADWVQLTTQRAVDGTAVFVTGTGGVKGGGDLTAHRTLELAIENLPELTAPQPSDASVALYSALSQSHKRATVAQVAAQVPHDALADVKALEHVDHSAVSVLAGEGLTGGGDLTSSLSLALSMSSLAPLVAPFPAPTSVSLPLYQTFNGQQGRATVAELLSQVPHDSLSGVETLRHVDHSAVSVAAGEGLTGGGDLTANRSLGLNLVGLTEDQNPSPHDATLAWYSAAAGGHRRGTLHQVLSQVSHDTLAGVVADQHVSHSSVSVVGTQGLSGGGDLTTSRSLALDVAGLSPLDVTNTDVADKWLAVVSALSGNHHKVALPVFGTCFHTDELTVPQQTTSGSFNAVHTYATPTVPAGSYLILWNAAYSVSGTVTAGRVSFQVVVNGDTTLAGSQSSFNVNLVSSQRIPVTLWDVHALSAAGSLSVQLQFSTTSLLNTLTVPWSRVVLFRVA